MKHKSIETYLIEALKENERLNILLDPSVWTLEMVESWDNDFPGLQKAFDMLKECEKDNELVKCPECWSVGIVIFDGDNDICTKCGHWFPGA